MKRIQPIRNCGKFICLDGTQHDWFVPICKTLLHSIKVCLVNHTIKKDVLKNFVKKPSFDRSSYEPNISWLGHSTFLIQVGGKNILTDPIFGSLSFVFRRLIPSVVKAKNLPRIDYVLISHNHFDHMDSKTLQDIKKHSPDVKVLAPMGDKNWFDKHGFKDASEHMWWDEVIDGDVKDLKFTFLPANHWSQRTLFDKNKSLWGSWMIQLADYKIYFAGDTSWGHHFEAIGKEFGSIDVACMPIAPGEPKSWIKESHIDAEEAVKAFVLLRAKKFIPMHWGTFQLGFDDFYAPLKLLQKTWKSWKKELQGRELKVMKFGELFTDTSLQIIAAVKSIQKDFSAKV